MPVQSDDRGCVSTVNERGQLPVVQRYRAVEWALDSTPG